MQLVGRQPLAVHLCPHGLPLPSVQQLVSLFLDTKVYLGWHYLLWSLLTRPLLYSSCIYFFPLLYIFPSSLTPSLSCSEFFGYFGFPTLFLIGSPICCSLDVKFWP